MKYRFLLALSSLLLASCTNNTPPVFSSSGKQDESVSSVSSKEESVSSASSKEDSVSSASSKEESVEVSSKKEESESSESQEVSISQSEEIQSESSEQFLPEPSEEILSLDSIDEPQIKSDDSEDDTTRVLTLDENNCRVTGSYSASERTIEVRKDDGSMFTLGYVQCMGSTQTAFNLAQMSKNSGKLYSLSALPLRAISVTFSSPKPIKLEALTAANTGTGALISDETVSGQTYLVPEGNPYFRISAGANAAYIKTITLTYGGSGELPVYDSSSSQTQSHTTSISDGPSPEEALDPATYYQSISETASGATLKTSLHNLIKGHTNKGYNFAYTAYPYTDADKDGYIIDTYSACRFKANYDYQGGPCGVNNYSKEGDCFNREHTIPQSVFNEGQPMKSDLHHLLPTDGYVNNQRSNYPHAEVGTTTYVSTNGTKVGDSTTTGYSGKACEPIDEYKGDFARIYFYMVTRYEDVLSKWGSYACFEKNTYPSLSSWAISLYLKWNEQDPVSEKEIHRNDAVSGYQKNRNPFVDHPEYAARIWGK